MATDHEQLDTRELARKAGTTVELVEQYLQGTLPTCFSSTIYRLDKLTNRASYPAISSAPAIESLRQRNGSKVSLLQIQLLVELESGPAGIRDLTDRLNLAFNEVKTALTGLTYHGYIEKYPGGKRRLSNQWRDRQVAVTRRRMINQSRTNQLVEA